MKLQNKFSLTTSITVIIVFAAFGIGLFLFFKQTLKTNISEQLHNTTSMFKDEIQIGIDNSIKSHLRTLSHNQLRLAEYLYEQSQSDVITEEEAYTQFREIILDKEYGKVGKTGYLAGVSASGILTIHPKSEGADITGTVFWPKVKNILNSDSQEGYFTYNWKNKGEEKAREKAGYITYFKPWDLIVWASSYTAEFTNMINVSDFRKEILSKSIGKTGYAYVMDSNGTLLIHPTSEGENISDKSHIQEMLNKKSGSILYRQTTGLEGEGKDKLVYYETIPETGWIVASGSYTKEIYSSLTTFRNIFILTMIGLIIIIITVSIILGKNIGKRINSVTDIFAKTSQGDLTTRFSVPSVVCSEELQCGKTDCPLYKTESNQYICYLEVGSEAPKYGKEIQCPSILNNKIGSCYECNVYKKIAKDEITALGAEFNHFISRLQNSISRMQDRTNKLDSLAEEMSSDSQQSASNIEQISSSSSQISNNLQTQNDKIDSINSRFEEIMKAMNNINSLMEDNNAKVQTATSSMEEMSANINNTAQVSKKAESMANELQDKSEETSQSVENMGALLEHLSEGSKNVNEIGQVIMDLAEQTNLLSMNASIEAAHAGEYGKGFAVVAEEIRKLATKSSENANNIKEIVKKNSNDQQSLIQSAGTVKSLFSDLKHFVNQVNQINQETSSSMSEQSEANQSVLNAIQEIQESSNTVVQNLETQTEHGNSIVDTLKNDLMRISNEITTAITEVEKALKETSQKASHISQISSNVKEISSLMEEDFGDFTTN